MAVHLRLVNHDRMFDESPTNPIVVNQFDLSSESDKEEFNKLIYTTYSEESLELHPSCECGAVKGEYNVGVLCSNCNTPCLSVTERPLESALWIAAPNGVSALINPEAWIIMDRRLTVSGVSILRWLVDPMYKVPTEKEPYSITKLKEYGVTRGLNYFYQHFDELMDLLINRKVVKAGKLREREDFLQFVRENREAIFSKHLPIPSKLAFITEQTPMGVYADTTTNIPAIDAIRTISHVENSITPLSVKSKESKTAQAINKLAEYYMNFMGKPLGSKPGWFRKHIFGSRVHFSFRAVITSLSDPHHLREVHLPWSMSVMFLKMHLVSKMLKRGLTPNEANRKIYEGTLQYDSLIDEIFQELIQESPTGGIEIILQRNPSLTRGSAQNLSVTKIKTDPKINTVSLSVLVLSSLNADFDGSMVAVVKVP